MRAIIEILYFHVFATLYKLWNRKRIRQTGVLFDEGVVGDIGNRLNPAVSAWGLLSISVFCYFFLIAELLFALLKSQDFFSEIPTFRYAIIVLVGSVLYQVLIKDKKYISIIKRFERTEQHGLNAGVACLILILPIVIILIVSVLRMK